MRPPRHPLLPRTRTGTRCGATRADYAAVAMRDKGSPVRESAASRGKTPGCAILDGMATVELSRAARAFRFGHAAIAVAFLLAIGYV